MEWERDRYNKKHDKLVFDYVRKFSCSLINIIIIRKTINTEYSELNVDYMESVGVVVGGVFRLYFLYVCVCVYLGDLG